MIIIKKILIFLAIPLISLNIFAKGQPEIEATEINVFNPKIKPTRSKVGFCWMGSLAVSRSNAFRCMVASDVLDPCFVVENPRKVICGADPTKKKIGFFLKLTRPIAKRTDIKTDEVGEVGKNDAWIIKLSNDQICYRYTGTMPIIHQGEKVLAIKYGCGKEKNGRFCGLLDDSVNKGKIWRAKKIIYETNGVENKVIKNQSVTIKKVWR